MRVNTFAKIAATGIAAAVLSIESATAQSTKIIPFFDGEIYSAEHNGAKVMFVRFKYFTQNKKGIDGTESDYIVSREVIDAYGRKKLPGTEIKYYNTDADGILKATEDNGIRTVFFTYEQLKDKNKVDITNKFMKELPAYQGDINKYNRIHTNTYNQYKNLYDIIKVSPLKR